MAEKTIKCSLKLDENVHTRIHLAARYARVSPDKLVNRILEDFLTKNRELILDSSPDKLRSFLAEENRSN